MRHGSKQWNDYRRFAAKAAVRDAIEKREAAAQDLDTHVEKIKINRQNSNNPKDQVNE